MSDLFHEDGPASFIRRVWSVMERAGRLLHGRIWDEYPAVAAPAVA